MLVQYTMCINDCERYKDLHALCAYVKKADTNSNVVFIFNVLARVWVSCACMFVYVCVYKKTCANRLGEVHTAHLSELDVVSYLLWFIFAMAIANKHEQRDQKFRFFFLYVKMCVLLANAFEHLHTSITFNIYTECRTITCLVNKFLWCKIEVQYNDWVWLWTILDSGLIKTILWWYSWHGQMFEQYRGKKQLFVI